MGVLPIKTGPRRPEPAVCEAIRSPIEQMDKHRSRARRRLLVATVALSVCLAASLPMAISIGSAGVTPTETVRFLWAAMTGGSIDADEVAGYQIVWQVRTPRVLMSVVVGAGLAVVGVAMQAMVRNALADPYVLGVSSGASVGAVTVSVFGGLTALGMYAVSGGAFLGALLAAVAVYSASYSRGGVAPLRLVLTGVALGFGFHAIMSVLIYFAPGYEAASTILYWSLGSFGAATWGALPIVGFTVPVGIILVQRASRALDVMALGDETSASLGVDSTRLRTRMFVITSLMTGAMVAVSGAIGFIGLIMPHLVRMTVGSAHARVLTVAPLVGAVFMVWVDVLSRTVAAPRELPLGVITALVGVPVFIALLRGRGYLFGGR